MSVSQEPEEEGSSSSIFCGFSGWIAQRFYRHGLFSSSHPKCVLLIATLGVIWACLPLWNNPIYGGDADLAFTTNSTDLAGLPHWLKKEGEKDIRPPVAYIQQIILKAMVHPYEAKKLLHRNDAFRGPIAAAFKLHLEDLNSFQVRDSNTTMDTECLRTDGLSPRYKNSAQTFPDYGCLILSPANLWRRDLSNFQIDVHLISTIFQFQQRSREGRSSLLDLIFGMKQRDSGITKYPVRNRQRVISFAVTIVLKRNSPQFIEALRNHLYNIYPIHQENNTFNKYDPVTHLFFPSRPFYLEVLPFGVVLLLLFAYVYFSCCKIELVHSKFGIALSAVLTVLGAISMSLGLSSLSLNLSSKKVVLLVPYLVAFISLENVLVITRSVVSTPTHFDVKIRVAQGLRLEGWNITKSLFTEITILCLGFFIGIMDESIQDFCLLALMGILSDFFLQIFFFVTLLSIDMSIHDDFKDSRQRDRDMRMFQFSLTSRSHCINKNTSKKHGNQMKPSKRVRLLYFWAQRRIIQRLFTLCMIIWIITFIYKHSGIFELFLKNRSDQVLFEDVEDHLESVKNITNLEDAKKTETLKSTLSNRRLSDILSNFPSQVSPRQSPFSLQFPKSLNKLLHREPLPWKNLPYTHWPMLFGLYNISLFGKHVSVLPPILISMTVSPESALRLRPPAEVLQNEDMIQNEKELEAQKGSTFYEDDDINLMAPELSPFVPSSPGELFLAGVFAVPSILFFIYIVVVIYRIVCSRNYAEWRSSWSSSKSSIKYDNSIKILGNELFTQITRETTPVPIDSGHTHEVDCLQADGNVIVSMCLSGKINTWDRFTGENYSHIDRKKYFERSCSNHTLRGSSASPHKFIKPKKFPDFSHTINTNFTTQKRLKSTENPYDFSKFTEIQNKFDFVEKAETCHGEEEEEDVNFHQLSSVWVIEVSDGLLYLGCSNGRVEIWEPDSGTFKCSYESRSAQGITHLKIIGTKIIIAHITGLIDLLELSLKNDLSSKQTSARRQRVQSGNESSANEESFTIQWVSAVRAHQQPLSCMVGGGGKILTGSQDHTLRVFRLDNNQLVGIYTLHGHCGPISAVFIDKLAPICAGSGALDGTLRLWDLLSGACLYSIQAHEGAVLSLAHSPSYIISMGDDEKLCIWERFQGHLINSIDIATMGGSFSRDLIMLTHNLLVTSRQGTLIVWDVRLTDPVRIVKLGDSDVTHTVQVMKHLDDTVICNYGNQIRLVHFPILSDKID